MEYTTLGSTGLTVSRICLGCMSFGSSAWRDWVLDEDDSHEIINNKENTRAFRRGMNPTL
jgi:aryl-alcohol dehydrogenase-like predicted oxidoreductase